MTEKVPFKALAFSFTDRAHGRMTVRMKYVPEQDRKPENGDDSYLVHIEQGPAERTVVKLDKGASVASASALCTQMLEAGVFSWDEVYGDDVTVGPSRWMLNMILEPDVFEVHVRGGSMYPCGFDAMMEGFYALGLPRPADLEPSKAGFPSEGFGALGAMGMFNPTAMQGMMAQMQKMLGQPGAPDIDWEQMQMVMRDMQSDPARMQDLIRSEFRSMPADQRNAMLDMLASTGFGSRDWWERFFLG